jgi:hypothetical protein
VTDESTERGRAKREYLVAGALAMTAAVIAVALEPGGEGGNRRLELLAVAVLAATMYGRVAYGLFRERDEASDSTTPAAGRMRRMAVIWYLLAGVLGAAVLRAPFAVWRSSGLAGLLPGEWLAAALGAAIVLAAAGRAVLSIVGGRRGGGGVT